MTDGALRSVVRDAQFSCSVKEVRRLRLFSLVVPRPTEGEGDSLQVAFRVEDAARGEALLVGLGLESGHHLQRPPAGPFAGATVQAPVERHPADEHEHPRFDQVIAVVRLWNDAAIYDVTADRVNRAAAIELRLDAMAGALPRETRLLARITRERNPELFDSSE